MGYVTIKRILDFLVACAILMASLPVFLIIYVASSISTRSHGIYRQNRIGLCGKPFIIFKFKSMHDNSTDSDCLTSINNPRITRVGRIIRRTKMDELPQLINIIRGEMSFVGPRPDVPGYADLLDHNTTYLCKVKPGITCQASLYFQEEEFILEKVADRKKFNDEVIWPTKLKINNHYALNYSFKHDLLIIFQTLGILKTKRFKLD